MGVLLSIAVVLLALYVLKVNYPRLKTDADHDAKCHYALAVAALVLVFIGGLHSVVLSVPALAILAFRAKIIEVLFTK